MMNVLSYNLRGLGGLEKKHEIHNLVQTHKPKVLCIQETKMEVVDRSLCTWLWRSVECDFLFKSSDGRSRGILTIWDNNLFFAKKKISKEHYLWLVGEWGASRTHINLVNVYAPCEDNRKILLWQELETKIQVKNTDKWYVVGDFNAVRDTTERKVTNGNSRSKEMEDFDEFISEESLIDLPLHGR